MNLTIQKTKNDLNKLATDEGATYTREPSGQQVTEFVNRLLAEEHEREILTSPGVAEGIAQANSVIENWRASHR